MTRTIIALSLVAFTGLATSAGAQSPTVPAAGDTHGRWGAFVGCWRSVDDPAGTGARVCVVPATRGVTLTTIVGGQKVSEDTRVADGIAHPVDSDGCRGSETIRWSDNGFRLYRTATIACDGGLPRTLATASFFVPGPVWVDIETVDAGGTTSVRVTRLVRSRNQQLADGAPVARPAADRAWSAEAMAGFTVPDVIDLSRALPADGVQAALTEAPARYRLNARSLVAMSDAGVGDKVIDLMVGLTYPEKFNVQRVAGGGWSAGAPGFTGMSDPFFAPLVGSAAMFNCYSSYGWAASSYWGNCMGYDPRAYSMYPGYYSGYYGVYGPTWVVTQPGAGTTTPGEASGEGRVVNGRGYTQVRPVDTTSTGGNGNRVSGTSAGDSSSSGGSSGSSGVSGSGYSGGGGGERTAVPRGPGGGS